MSALQATHTQVVILLGPPGAGKGSQAALIQENQNIAHISTGDLLRAHIQQGSELGEQAKTYMDQGELVPDELIFDMLTERTSREDCKSGYMLDGFPRNLAQAQELQRRLQNCKTVAIYLKARDDAIIERITKRQVCKSCQTPYHLVYSPSKQHGVCDTCGGQLYQRSDDTKEILENRLKVYREKTAPLIEFYKEKDILYEIDSTRLKEAILLDILRVLHLLEK